MVEQPAQALPLGRGTWATPHVPYAVIFQDSRLSVGRTLYGGLQVTAAAAGAAELRVYDGTSAQGQLLMHYRVPAGESRSFLLEAPILLYEGLYVQFVANVEEALVIYKALGD